MTTTADLDYIGTHRAEYEGNEQPAPTQWPDDMPDRCWAVVQGKRCAEHAERGAA